MQQIVEVDEKKQIIIASGWLDMVDFFYYFNYFILQKFNKKFKNVEELVRLQFAMESRRIRKHNVNSCAVKKNLDTRFNKNKKYK